MMPDLSPYGKTFELDNQMDLVIDDLNKLVIIDGQDKISQDMQVLFRTHLDDNIFHRSFGINFDAIALSKYSPVVIKGIVAEVMNTYRFIKQVKAIYVEETYENNEKNITISMQIILYSEEEVRLSVVI